MDDSAAGDFRDGVPFIGGSLWIDFLNSVMLDGGRRVDFLADAAGRGRWMGLAGLDPATGDDADAPVLREGLRTAFEAMAAGQPLPGQLIAQVNDLLAGLRITLALAPGPGGPRLVQREAAVAAPLATAVALDFARFVAEFQPDRLRHCANPACTMVFHDHGRNNRRRWCSMAACGNRDKVASYRARHRNAP